MYILGWTDQRTQSTSGIAVPCLLSFLTDQNFDATVTGLNETPSSDWPQVNLVFQMYHLMINLGMLFVLIGLVGCGLWVWGRRLWENRWMLRALVVSVILTELATLSGWWTAEFGRQPWIVWNVLRTDGAQSPNIGNGQLIFSITMFVVLYALVLFVFLRLLDRKIKDGPPPPTDEQEIDSLPDSFGEIFRRRSRVSSGSD
jgi:cytochrome d ubiquinol oxidase subunit I